MTTTATTTRGDLSTRTLASLHAYFDAQQHQPSPAHWAGLDDIATALEDMAGAYTAIPVARRARRSLRGRPRPVHDRQVGAAASTAPPTVRAVPVPRLQALLRA